MSHVFKDKDIDWPRVFHAMTHPKKDEHGEEYIDATSEEMTAVDQYCTFLLSWKFRERPELPIEMQQKQDEAFRSHCQKSFAYLNKEPVP